MTAILFALSITLPNLLLMALGLWMQKKSQLNPEFLEVASNMVFNYCLPCLLFLSVIKSDVNIHAQLPLLTAGICCTLILFLCAEIYAKFFIAEKADQGVFVQGVFRSNMAIIGLVTVTNAYGQQGMSIGAIYMGVLTILYNILSIITLSRTQTQQGSLFSKSRHILLKMLKNPLMVALISAFIYKALHLPALPQFLMTTATLLSAVALPLALICAGATLDLKTMLKPSGLSMQASIGRIIIAPTLAVFLGLAFRLEPIQLGVLFLMVSCPAAAASYVMAKAMGGNAILAANILGFTTVFSMLAIAIGSTLLRLYGLM